MKSSFEHRVRVPDDVFVQQVENESAILRLSTETYYGLDDVATRMWQALTSAPTIGDAHTNLLESYDVSPEVLERDLLDFVDKLRERELLTLDDAA